VQTLHVVATFLRFHDHIQRLTGGIDDWGSSDPDFRSDIEELLDVIVRDVVIPALGLMKLRYQSGEELRPSASNA
jgi:hypothetical protein